MHRQILAKNASADLRVYAVWFNMLFGDSHVENFRFPKELDNWIGMPPDVNFTWW